jgi:hypothetical protein
METTRRRRRRIRILVWRGRDCVVQESLCITTGIRLSGSTSVVDYIVGESSISKRTISRMGSLLLNNLACQ